MKVTLDGYVCDQCEQFHESNADFFVVNRGDFIVEVCTPSCLRRMALDLMKAEQASGPKPKPKPEPKPVPDRTMPSDEAIDKAQARLNVRSNGTGGSTPNDEPCDQCGKMLPTRQGLGAHRFRAHGIKRLPNSKNKAASRTTSGAHYARLVAEGKVDPEDAPEVAHVESYA